MTRKDFERLVHEGAERIPEEFRPHLKAAALLVADEPTAEQKRSAGLPPGAELFGLYHGTPRTERAYLLYRLPDTITIFQRPLERFCGGDPACIREEVAHTVWHELAHALGMSEGRVRHVERGRRLRKVKP